MARLRLRQHRVATGSVWTAGVLLLGIVILAVGHYSNNRIAFYVGMLITLAGVLNGIRQIVQRGEPWRTTH